MIIPTRWRDIEGGMRVIDPAGQTFAVLPRVVPWLAQVRNLRGDVTMTIPVDPDAYVPRIFDVQDIAISNLRAAFGSIEYLGERK